MSAIYYVISLLSQIYVDGPILRAVQESTLFSDSKHFVDMALKFDPVITLQNFANIKHTLTKDRPDLLQKFVDDHFLPPGTELTDCLPEDWVPYPATFMKIQDFHMRRWALHLHRIWRDLCRKVKDDVRVHQELFSLLYVPNHFIIPGGRFREFYYWDSYWIVKGLLVSEMFETAKGMIQNLAYMVDSHGFVPNGGRVYYLLRSQPPLLTSMVYDYYVATGDVQLLYDLLPSLEKEYTFWLLHRATATYKPPSPSAVLDLDAQTCTTDKCLTPPTRPAYNFYQYRAHMKTPRPESYREDLHLVKAISNITERHRVWSDVASAAETGWDFSTRWFGRVGVGAQHMDSIRTWRVVPVDLNAYLCMNARMMASMYEMTGNLSKVLVFQRRFEEGKMQMRDMHWNETDGIWYDYDMDTREHVNEYYVSNALPLYARCYDNELAPKRVHNYFQTRGIFNWQRGPPTSLFMNSHEQWDKENAWPPMVHMVIEGFRQSGDDELMATARNMAFNWVRATYRTYIHNDHAMFEKYNVSGATSDETAAGSGGEYEVQTGFGWTNGVVLDLLDKYGEEFVLLDDVPGVGCRSTATIVVLICAFMALAVLSCS